MPRYSSSTASGLLTPQTRRALRLALPLILAGASVVIVLGVMAGPQSVAHAVSARPAPVAEDGQAAPLGAPVAAPAAAPLADVGGPSVITVCLSTCPYASVQAAVYAVAPGGTVKVAQGVYTVSAGGSVVQITQAITLRGGYTVTDWSVSNPVSYPTILDAEKVSGRQVVYIDNVSARVEGFHIRNGNVTGNGGGIYAGGASTPVIVGNYIYSNTAAGSVGNGHGGGIYIAGGSAVVQGNEVFTNTAGIQGGGIHIAGGSAVVQGNEIFTNTAGLQGGGIYVDAGSSNLENNRIYDNVANGTLPDDGGGGVYLRTGSPTVRRNDIYGNSAYVGSGSGGGIHILSASPVTVERNMIHDNRAAYRGGGIHLGHGNQTIRNNLVYSNTATTFGGGIHVIFDSPTIENNTVYGNTGHGIYDYNQAGSTPVMRNNIVVSNTGSGIERRTGSLTANYNDASGNGGGGDYVNVTGTGNITANPQLVKPGVDFGLQAGSPCRDAVLSSLYSPDDYDGRARPFGANADMGAYEYYEGACFARLDGGQVYTTVQAAVDAVTRTSGSTIQVAGVCTDVRGVSDGGQTFTQTAYLTKSLTLRGGYSATYWAAPGALTILDPRGQGRAIYITGTSVVTVDGFILRNANAKASGLDGIGGGVYVAAALSPTIQNILFYSNTASYGGGLALAGGSARVRFSTFVTNTAAYSGGALYVAAGAPGINSNIVVSNGAASGGGIFSANGAAPVLAYNDFWRNGAGGSYAGVTAGATDVSTDPRFVSSTDFHLRLDSPLIHTADPAGGPTSDWEGDSRPLGRARDVGADECATFPNVTLTPPSLWSAARPWQIVIYTYTLTNTGSLLSDTIDLTHTLTIVGPGSNWSVSYPGPFTLWAGESVQVPVVVQVGDAFSNTTGIVVLTATSRANATAYGVVSNTTIVNWNPGVRLTPVYSDHIDPGTTLVYVHMLTNTGNAADTFSLTWSTSPGWPVFRVTVAPTQPIALGPYMTTTVLVTVFVSDTAPGGLVEIVTLTATSWLSPTQRAVVTDTTEVNYRIGPRYVRKNGYDTLNNCQVPGSPCRTIAYAVDQAASGDDVRVTAETYYEHDLTLNKSISFRGGYSPDFSVYKPKTNPTVIDAQSAGRVLYIFGSPTVEGFKLLNGRTSGSGGGVYIGLGTPTLQHNTIMSSTASYGGGVYVGSSASAVIQRNKLAFNTAQRGGGLAIASVRSSVWNNLIYGNSAHTYGGGVYVAAGSPRIWHDTIFSNTANAGGGIYLGGGSPMISNTIVVSNVASTGGGIYSQTAGTALAYNDVWGNANGDYYNASPDPNSLAVDPLFEDPARYIVRITALSPAKDKAQPSVVRDDYWGNPRPLPITGTPDIGAYEYLRAGLVIAPDNTALGVPKQTITYTHVVTNIGEYTDTVEIEVGDSLGWPLRRISRITVTLGVNMTSTVVVTTYIPAGTFSDTVNTMIVTATSGNGEDVWVTAVDTTTVGQGLGVSFEPDDYGLPKSGQTIVYSHILTNEGNYTDTFTLQRRSIMTSWPITLSAQYITLTGGATATVWLSVSVPANVPANTVVVDTTWITATSQYSQSVFAVVVDTTYANRIISITLAPDRRGSNIPGQRAIYTNTLTNVGNYTETVLCTWGITYTSRSDSDRNQVWGISVSPVSVTLGAFQTRTVVVTVTIPFRTLSDTAVLSGTMGTAFITATAWLTQAVSSMAVDTTTVGPMAGVKVYPDDNLCWPTSASTQTISYYDLVTNTGNFDDAYVVTATNSNGWAVQLNYTTTPAIPPDTGWTVRVDVTVPPSSPDDHATSVRASSVAFSATQYGPVYNNTWFHDYGGRNLSWTADPSYVVVNALGEVFVVFTDTLTFSSTTGGRSVYLDSEVSYLDGWWLSIDSISPTFPRFMNPGDTVAVTVRLKVKAGTPVYDVGAAWLTAYIGECEYALVGNSVFALRPDVTLVPDYDSYTPHGSVITYAHSVTNTGGVPDVYTITWGASLPGWGIQVVPTTTSPLWPGDGQSVMVTVTVPWGVLSDTVNTLILTATSSFNPVVLDTAIDRTTVAYGPGALLAPDNSGSVDAGGVITYHHTLTNTGNHTETFDLETHGSFGFAEVHPYTVTLGPGEVYSDVAVTVYMPLQAAEGEVEMTEDIATFFGSHQVVALDTTTVGPAAGTRYVAPDGRDGNNSCLDSAGFGPCATLRHALNKAVPGDAIHVAQGVYTGGLTLNKQAFLQGGYNLDLGWEAPPDPVQHPSTLDAQGLGRVLSVTGNISPTIAGFRIVNGSAIQGGGVYISTNRPVTLAASILYSNSATSGGAVYVGSGSLMLVNDVMYANTATSQGGAIYVAAGSTTALVNDTLVANSANTGGALYQAGGTMLVTNTILVGNTAVVTGGAVYQSGGAAAMDYSDLWNNAPNDGNVPAGANSLSADPSFQDAAFHLKADSLCIDRGVTVTLDTDYEGDARPQWVAYDRPQLWSAYDIGADEFALRRSMVLAPAFNSRHSTDPQVFYQQVLSNTGTYTDAMDIAATLDLAPLWTLEVYPTGLVTLASNAATTIWVTVTVPGGTEIGTAGTTIITATLRGSAAISTAVDLTVYHNESDVEIHKYVAPTITSWLGPGYLVTYTLVYWTNGPADAMGVRISDSLPISLTGVVSVSTGPRITPTGSLPDLVWTVSPFSRTQSGIITVTGRLSLTPGLVTHITNVVRIATSQYDITPANNVDSVLNWVDSQSPSIPTLLSPADRALTATRTITFTWQPSDDGAGSDQVGYQFVISGNTYYTQSVVPYPVASTMLVNLPYDVYTWTVRALDQVGNASNWASPRLITVGLPILNVSKQFTPTVVVAGAPLTYNVTVSNTGLVGATGIVVTDTLPSGAFYVSGGSYDGASRVVSWTVAALGPTVGITQVTFAITTCQVATNTWYRVVTSTEGISSTWGVSTTTPITLPTFTATFTQSVSKAGVYLPVFFTDTTRSNGGPMAAWRWDYGDGGIGSGAVVSHEYASANAFTITLRVTDTCGYARVATGTVTVFEPRVVLTKTAQAQVDAGLRLTYTFLLTNTGYNDLTNVRVTDTLPVFIAAGGEASPTVSGAIAPGVTITWTVGSLPIGESRSMMLVVTVTSPLTNGTWITNTAWVTTTQGARDRASVSTRVRSAPILEITKRALTTVPPAGSPLTFTIQYTNTGNANATGVVITDALPMNITGAYTASRPFSGTFGASQLITWNLPLVPGANGAGLITLTVNVVSPLDNRTVLTNTTGITCSEGVGGAVGPVTVTVTSAPQLTITKSSAPAGAVSPGDRITYTLRITNTGNENGYNVAITDVTPLSTTFVSADIAAPAAGSIISPAQGAAGTVVWRLTTPITAPGGFAVVTLTVQVNMPLNNRTPIANSDYSVTAVDVTAPAIGSPIINTVVATPTLVINKVALPSVPANTPLTYTISYANIGMGNATGVVITDRLPLNISGDYSTSWPFVGTFGGGQVITWYMPDLPGLGGIGAITLIVTPTRSLMTGTVLANTAGITCSDGVITVTSPVTVTTYHGDPVSLSIAPTGATVRAGFTQTYAVTGTDVYGNEWNVTQDVAFAPTGGAPGGYLVGNVFTATTPTGAYPITATAFNGVSITTMVYVTLGTPVSLTIFPRSWTATAGDWVTYTAVITDAYGNSAEDPGGTLFTANGGGAFNANAFSATVAGAWIVTGTHAPSLNDTTTLTIKPGPFGRLTMSAVTTQTAGLGFTLVFTAYDAFNNPAPGSGVLSLVDSSGTLLPATWSIWTSTGATLMVTITRALVGDQITATVVATPTIQVTSNPFTVLPNAPASFTLLQINPANIPLVSTARVTGTVVDAYMNLVSDGTPVVFTTTAGALSNRQLSYTTATASGTATTVLTATCQTQLITITAQAGAAVTQTTANFVAPGAPFSASLMIVSDTLPVGGVATVLTATVRDCGNNSVADGTPVALEIAPIWASIVPSNTATSGGTAMATLTSPTKAGDSIITVTSGLAWARRVITFTPLEPITVTVWPAQSAIAPLANTNVIASVTDRYGNGVANGTPVTFTATMGTITPTRASTLDGLATVKYTAGITEGTAVVTATISPGAQATTTIVIRLYYLYLPIVLRDYSPPVPGRNLIVSAINAPTNPMSVTVVIQNTGTLSITGEFGVSLYVDPPNPSQIRVNYPWYWVGCQYGMIWTVTTTVRAGQSLTLTVPMADRRPGYYSWPPNRGTHSLWALVDAWGSEGPVVYGLVQETNESDNIRGPVTLNVP